MHPMLNLHLMKQKKRKFNENIKAKIADCTRQSGTICLNLFNAISFNRLNASIFNKRNKNLSWKSLWRWLLAVLRLFIEQIQDFRQGRNLKLENHDHTPIDMSVQTENRILFRNVFQSHWHYGHEALKSWEYTNDIRSWIMCNSMY